MNAAKSKILYVDDDSDDCIFLQTTLNDAGYSADLVHIADGEDAVQYLRNAAPEALPSLIVLDLNMPRWDGQKILTNVKANPFWAGIPVVILSVSDNESKKENCRQLGAVSYFKKPFHFNDYKGIVDGFFSAMQA